MREYKVIVATGPLALEDELNRLSSQKEGFETHGSITTDSEGHLLLHVSWDSEDPMHQFQG